MDMAGLLEVFADVYLVLGDEIDYMCCALGSVTVNDG